MMIDRRDLIAGTALLAIAPVTKLLPLPSATQPAKPASYS